MDEATIKSMAAELAKGLKTPEDLNQMTAIFKKFMIETALNTELSDHLGYEKHQPKKGSNSRNGFSSKTVSTQDGQLVLDIPRDREALLHKDLKCKAPLIEPNLRRNLGKWST
jgi:putative transposase